MDTPTTTSNVKLTWSQTPPEGVHYLTHKFGFIDALYRAALEAGNYAVIYRLDLGQGAAALIQTLPQFLVNKDLSKGDKPDAVLSAVLSGEKLGDINGISVYLTDELAPREYKVTVLKPFSATGTIVD